MKLFYKNTKQKIKVIQEDEEHYRITDNCCFCGKEISSKKVKDHCNLKGEYRRQARRNCNINVTQKQSKFTTFIFHKFSNYDCHLFFKELIDMKKDELKLDIIP